MPKVKTSKEAVLNKVIPLIRKRGIANTSMADLAKECEIQKSHFYYYFDSKDALVKEVLATTNSYFSYNLNKVLSNSQFSISEKLKGIEHLLGKLFTNRHEGCVMANTALEAAYYNPIYFDEVAKFFDCFINGLIALLEVNYDKNEAKELAEQIVQDIEGGILLMKVYQDQRYLFNAIKRMRKLINKL
ncbi:TetR/AcrR family transcriptional regulator [Spongiivirga citrea]|uniref:TetR family transcriptional regulator n=1 Tax=Spongiivirga citrea TaxID=1481457 RepID=A0A6M0CKU5_9FLAO|nr:TetR/AcrR family transcriptional regulator [Spongiivirga citrea]NER16469.1 TetR family transcriptional regulator [Spongiivirga citrea]